MPYISPTATLRPPPAPQPPSSPLATEPEPEPVAQSEPVAPEPAQPVSEPTTSVDSITAALEDTVLEDTLLEDTPLDATSPDAAPALSDCATSSSSFSLQTISSVRSNSTAPSTPDVMDDDTTMLSAEAVAAYSRSVYEFTLEMYQLAQARALRKTKPYSFALPTPTQVAPP
ncbi:uncharacterized protein EHS24_008423 [Apiotrichum porosum]|uniref:Uncharacterized protein n=1 Tax=Apiotrichum porosum TaxID=105984 RepID=A0A427XQ94_9TREE|nr:uncharacterized protein EHS24_008423 [Apiotrichum porosum]RSH80991.1 hypothetical protein EHS24_008423 [Apiotrichum porosum]